MLQVVELIWPFIENLGTRIFFFETETESGFIKNVDFLICSSIFLGYRKKYINIK